MKYELRIKLLIVAVLAATTGAFAQKFPENRTTRQGTRLYDKGDYTGAEAKYRHALDLNPELREAAFNLGGALWRQEKMQEAAEGWISLATDSLAPVSMVEAASHNLGNAALAGEQLDAAIEAYKQSLRIDPGDMETKFNLAYAQKMKQQQEQNEDQDDNKEENQDNQGGGGHDNRNDRNDPQDGEGDQNDQNNQNDPQDGNGDGQNGNEPPPPPSGQGPGEAKMDRQAAEQMLDAMQAAEDDTREKVNAKEVRVGARSGKNW